MNTRTISPRAFTLIELLVVIAIIAILVSILMPSLARAKEMGKRISCLSNQHNIAMAARVYSSESNGAFPISEEITGTGGPDVCAFVIRQYGTATDPPVPMGLGLLVAGRHLQPSELFYCPSLDNRAGGNPGRGMNGINGDGVGIQWWNDPAHDDKWVLIGYLYREPSFYRMGAPGEHVDTIQPVPGFAGRVRATESNLKGTRVLLVDHLDYDFGFKYGHRDGFCRTYSDGHGSFLREDALGPKVDGKGWIEQVMRASGHGWMFWGQDYPDLEEYMYAKIEKM